jgi:hypothetical protein
VVLFVLAVLAVDSTDLLVEESVLAEETVLTEEPLAAETVDAKPVLALAVSNAAQEFQKLPAPSANTYCVP